MGRSEKVVDIAKKRKENKDKEEYKAAWAFVFSRKLPTVGD